MSICCSNGLPGCQQKGPVEGAGPSPVGAPAMLPLRPRPRPRRPLRVLYPPLVRKVLPKEESSRAKRWLLLLSAVLLLQIYNEESQEPLGPHAHPYGLEGQQGMEGQQGQQIYSQESLEGPHAGPSSAAKVQSQGPGLRGLTSPPLQATWGPLSRQQETTAT